jgi:hypothetical protein
MTNVNNTDAGAEVARLTAKVEKLERSMVELEHWRLFGIVTIGGPDQVAEFLKRHPEHADVAAEMTAQAEADRAERQASKQRAEKLKAECADLAAETVQQQTNGEYASLLQSLTEDEFLPKEAEAKDAQDQLSRDHKNLLLTEWSRQMLISEERRRRNSERYAKENAKEIREREERQKLREEQAAA